MPQRTVLRSAAGVGAYAAERREALDLTQTELARRIGVSREWVVRFEKGAGGSSLISVMAVFHELGVALVAEADNLQEPT